ncbi:MAG: sporulation protein YtxC [Clostridia bacterium]
MREIALATGVENKQIIDYLYANVKSKIDFCKTIITNYSDSNFSYLLFACDDNYIEPCESILKEIIVEYIESVYKVDYLKKRIKNPLNETLTFDAYIKVLSIFDKSTDISALTNIIILNETFFVDSFLEFRLLPLKKHWDNLVELSSDNISLFNSSTFLDIIRYLVNTMDNLVYKVKVVYDGENYSVYNMKNEHDHVIKIAECQNTLDLITNVLNSCPNYVDVYLKETGESEAVNFLSDVFTNRLKIYMNN